MTRSYNNEDIEDIAGLETINLNDIPHPMHNHKQGRTRDGPSFIDGMVHNPRLKFVKEHDGNFSQMNIKDLAFDTVRQKPLWYPGGYVIEGKSPLVLQTSGTGNYRRTPKKSKSDERDDRSTSSAEQGSCRANAELASAHTYAVY